MAVYACGHCICHDGDPLLSLIFIFFFFNDTATTEIYTLSLHDALPISNSFQQAAVGRHREQGPTVSVHVVFEIIDLGKAGDRKSTRLNSSHLGISYAVFCLQKKDGPRRSKHLT